MNDSLYTITYNPDVLSCLANLSSDEVFTPPEIVNQMLDMLPEELWHDKKAKFLDPACKSGVFLREIAKRLLEGLKDEIPDLQQRIDHIFQNQLYGISITELTSLLSRRSVYCSKYPNSIYSVSAFDNISGNIRYKNIQHRWQNGRCVFCGASENGDYGVEKRTGLETHAYEFIHTTKPEEIFKMEFDVIIGNPPYQLSTAGDDNGAQAKPIYQKFVQQALKLNPRFISMIIPARWYAGGWGLDEFRNQMMDSGQISELHDFSDSYDCFPSLGHQKIKGGICYFLLDRSYKGDAHFITHEGDDVVADVYRPLRDSNCDIVIRYSEAIPILHKITSKKELTFDAIVSTKKPFGFTTNYKASGTTFPGAIKLFAYKRIEYVKRSEVTRNIEAVDKHKLIVPKAVGTGESKIDVIKPIYCEPNSCCTETYLLVGPFNSKEECDNVRSYIATRFFHFLVTLKKNTQDCMKKVYSFVPMQDFSKPWTDKELYAKYGLTDDEIAFIESMIKPMDVSGGDEDV